MTNGFLNYRYVGFDEKNDCENENRRKSMVFELCAKIYMLIRYFHPFSIDSTFYADYEYVKILPRSHFGSYRRLKIADRTPPILTYVCVHANICARESRVTNPESGQQSLILLFSPQGRV